MVQTSASHGFIVYTGPGSSNSWIWLADFLEQNGFLKARFCPRAEEVLSAPGNCTAVIPGGDTFRIADEFGVEGLTGLKGKIRDGMGYIGICAGAYLPLRSSLAPLSSFNLLSAKVANISSEMPQNLSDTERCIVRYGCSYVFHPARGPVALGGEREIVAPIYGGPFLTPSDGERVRLRFSGVTEDTELFVDGDLYEKISFGRGACIEGDFGKGRVLSISPHLEHPDYPQANDYMRDLLLGFGSSNLPEEICDYETCSVKALRGIVADLRVLANAIDCRSWKVGIKHWEGEKLLFFVEAVRKRILRQSALGSGGNWAPMATLKEFERARDLLRKEGEMDTQELDGAVTCLSTGASHFLNAHFSVLGNESG